ncbi:MAG TPA: BamA/TamA family outer membrane protein [Sediminibacterium sp.]|nr:BamA/TamA family outer membrane protein [Sediminibacterium sp.]
MSLSFTKRTLLTFYTLALFLIAGSCAAVRAQVPEEHDLPQLIQKLLHPHGKPVSSDTIPQKLLFSFFPGAGYSLQTGFAVTAGASLAFFTDTAPARKISNILTSATYSQYNQFIFPLAANIFTRGNQYNLLVDYRFLDYPSTTFGLGPYTTPEDGYGISYNSIRLHQTLLRNLSGDWYAGMGIYYDHCWNIKELDPPEGVKTSLEKYGDEPQETAVGLAFRVLKDTRDNQINAKSGSFASFVFRPNFRWMGSDNSWQSMQLDYRKYISLPHNQVLALWSFDWFSLGKPPYLLLPSTGWDDQYNTGRGYIQSRYRSKNMVYAEAEYRFGLSQDGVLGAVIFANAQSFSRYLSDQLSVVAPGVGAGLRIKLNRHSHTNLCIDYGFGMDGSSGFFLNLGEVF